MFEAECLIEGFHKKMIDGDSRSRNGNQTLFHRKVGGTLFPRALAVPSDSV